MTKMRSELRVVDDKPEVWTNLGDILDWLQELPTHSKTPIAAGVALEIRQLLLDSVDNAEMIQGEDGVESV
jgi:hypothetical protein